MLHFSFVGVALLALASAAHADEKETVVRLAPSEIAAAQAEGAAKHQSDAVIEDAFAQPKRRLYSELGFGIDSRGGRAVYGAVVIPVGQDGYAAVSFIDATSGRRGR